MKEPESAPSYGVQMEECFLSSGTKTRECACLGYLCMDLAETSIGVSMGFIWRRFVLPFRFNVFLFIRGSAPVTVSSGFPYFFVVLFIPVSSLPSRKGNRRIGLGRCVTPCRGNALAHTHLHLQVSSFYYPTNSNQARSSK